MKVLITSIGTTTAVNLYKLLKETYQIVATDVNPYGYTSGSMLVDEFVQVPYACDPNYIKVIKDVVENYKIDVVIPINDIEIKSIVSSSICIHATVLVPSLDIVTFFDDKLQSSISLSKKGIAIGEIVTTNSDHIKTKVIQRQKYSVGSKGIAVYNSRQEVSSYLCSSYDEESFFIQEYIDGVEYTIDVACDGVGTPFLIIPRRRLEVKDGVASKVVIEKDDDLICIVKKIYSLFKIPYFSNIQFVKKGDKYYFIELNYRYGGMSIASAMASFNYVKFVIDHIVKSKPIKMKINDFPIKWGAVISRYQEETMYYEK